MGPIFLIGLPAGSSLPGLSLSYRFSICKIDVEWNTAATTLWCLYWCTRNIHRTAISKRNEDNSHRKFRRCARIYFSKVLPIGSIYFTKEIRIAAIIQFNLALISTQHEPLLLIFSISDDVCRHVHLALCSCGYSFTHSFRGQLALWQMHGCHFTRKITLDDIG